MKQNRNVASPVKRMSMFHFDVDVCVLAYKQLTYLHQVIDSVLNSDPKVSAKVYVLNNGGDKQEFTDYMVKYKNNPKVESVSLGNNLGFPGGCNYLARRGNSANIFMLNSDCILQPDALFNLWMEMKDPEVGVVGAKLIFPDLDIPDSNRPSGKIQHAGIEANIRSDFVHTFIGWNPDHPKVNMKRNPFAVTGACLMTSRNLWSKCGGFFEGYGRGTFEDVDYCCAARYSNKKVVYLPTAVGTHYTGASAQLDGEGFNLNQNRTIFMMRWQKELYWSEWQAL
jgi:GT2 family glycosyltransferase